MRVAEIRESKLMKCESCGGALLPTPSGKFSCMKMCGPLKRLPDEDAQKQALVIFGECREEDIHASVWKKWTDFVRSLPVATKSKVKGRVAWMLDGVPYRRGSRVTEPMQFGDAIYVVLTPRTHMRVTTLLPFDKPADAKPISVETIKASSNAP
jgi:hypothetical protein